MKIVPRLDTFKQSTLGHYIWIGLIVLSIFNAVMLAFAAGNFIGAFSQLFLAYIFHWVDTMEQEITRQNGGKT